MTKNDLTSLSAKVSPAPESARGGAEQTGPAYRRPELFVAGSTVELVQGTYGPYNDISGYYTYSEGLI